MERTYTENQTRAIALNGCDICVAAGAGSGKTGVLVERFIRIVTESREGRLPPAHCAGVDQILVITFTEKATKEMKSRIVEALTRLELIEERRQVETAYISTIHGFCSRVLQENPFEVGIDPHFTVLEEPQARRLLRQVVDSVVAEAYENNDTEITELVASIQSLRRFGEEQLDPVVSLSEAVEAVFSRLRSAGRRRDEIERHWQGGLVSAALSASDQLVWSVLTPLLDEVCAWVQAVRRMPAGLAGTARAACDALLTAADRVMQAGSCDEALAALQSLFGALGKARPGMFGLAPAEREMTEHVSRLRADFDLYTPLLKAEPPNREEAALLCRRMWGVLSAVWAAYDEAKRRQGKVDNDDLQAECVRLLEEYPDVRARYRRRLRYLMIDEFQDTNPLQMRLVELLHVTASEGSTDMSGAQAAPGLSSAPPNYLFVVGDAQQSIYGFRGADATLFRDMERRYRVEGAGEHVPLATNFRSRPEILGLIAHLFRQMWRQTGTRFVPLDAGASFDAVPQPAVEILLSQDLVRMDYLALEPAALARRIRTLVEDRELRISSHHDPRRGEPVGYRDIAVLLRQLTDIQKYEEAFAQAGVPAFVVGGGRGYYARQEIRDLVNILTVLDMPLNDVSLMAALRSPMVGAEVDTLYRIVEMAHGRAPSAASLERDTVPAINGANSETPNIGARERADALPLYVAMMRLLETEALPGAERQKLTPFVDTMETLRGHADRMPVGQLLERLITRTSYDARLLSRPHGRRRLANVRKLLQIANSDPALGVRDFIGRLRDLEKLSDREGDAPTEEEAADVVRFHTIHGAKGLEFPVVVLADLSRPLDHPERGLFVCDPHHLALGSRVCGVADPAFLAIDHRRRAADQEEAQRLLYVAMTRARERLILCGNLGRNRGLNWGDPLFSALGLAETPPEPELRTLIGGTAATVAPLSHYAHRSIAGGAVTSDRPPAESLDAYADRLVEALLRGEPLPSP